MASSSLVLIAVVGDVAMSFPTSVGLFYPFLLLLVNGFWDLDEDRTALRLLQVLFDFLHFSFSYHLLICSHALVAYEP